MTVIELTNTEFSVYTNLPDGFSENSRVRSDLDELRCTKHTFDIFFDDPAKEVFCSGNPVSSLRGDTQPYYVLAFLLKSVGETLPWRQLADRLEERYEREFDNREIANLMGQLRAKHPELHRTISTYRDSSRGANVRRGYSIAKITKTCLIVGKDSSIS